MKTDVSTSSEYSGEAKNNKGELPADFEWEKYLLFNKDLVDAGIDTREKAIHHWITCGSKSNRMYAINRKLVPDDFDCEAYLELKPGLKKKLALDLMMKFLAHWLKHGRVNNRKYRRDFHLFDETRPTHQFGASVFGFISTEFGLGEFPRGVCRALDGQVPFSSFAVNSSVQSNKDTSFVGEVDDKKPSYPINLISLNPPEARNLLSDVAHKEFFRGRLNIALWAWELDEFPEEWEGVFKHFDQIWTGSEFCKEVFEKKSPVPVMKVDIPLTFDPNDVSEYMRSHPKLTTCSETTFKVLCSFDYLSDVYRKNPFAVVDAFNKAFSAADDVVLIIKTLNADKLPHISAAFETYARETGLGDKIIFIDECFAQAR